MMGQLFKRSFRLLQVLVLTADYLSNSIIVPFFQNITSQQDGKIVVGYKIFLSEAQVIFQPFIDLLQQEKKIAVLIILELMRTI